MFVAAEVGFWSEPYVAGLANATGEPLAGAYVLRLREFCLLHGQLDGTLRGYGAPQIAAACGWRGRPKRFVELLEPWLGCRRRLYYLRDWRRSVTGTYCLARLSDAERKRRERAEEAAARAAKRLDEIGEPASDVPRTSTGRPSDVHRTSLGRPDIRKEGSKDAPPVPPAQRGDGVALTRWDWFAERHPRLRNSRVCKRILGELTDEQWAHLQHALPVQVLSSRWKKNTRYVHTADRYLRSEEWLEVPLPKSPEPAPTPTQRKRDEKAARTAAAKAAEEAAAAAEKNKADRLALLLEQLASSRASDLHKQRLKTAWLKEYPNERPWEAAS